MSKLKEDFPVDDKIKVGHTAIKINAHRVIEEAIEQGLRLGYNRAHKHSENPGEDHIVETQTQAVMNQLCEVINFD